MAARADRLGDDPATWEDDLRDLEVLVVVHAQSADALEAEAARWERELRAEGSGLELAHVAAGRRCSARQREHFGFTDGFSQPAIEGVAREDVRGQGIPLQARAVVAAGAERDGARSSPASSSSATRTRTAAPRPRRPRRSTATRASWCGASCTRTSRASAPSSPEQARHLELDEELVAAKLVGRWRDGSPLVLRPDGPDPALGNDKQRANDFRYGDDPLGLRCPRGAHVRRTNPRDALGWEGRLTARHRILRRGMPYGAGRWPRAPRTTARRAGCSSSACRRASRASSRSSRRSGATTATRSAWAARPTRSAGPSGERGPPRHRGRPAARRLAAAQLRRVSRRRVPRRTGRQRAAGAARSCSRTGHKTPRDERENTGTGGTRGTPFHAKSRPRVRPTLESQLP